MFFNARFYYPIFALFFLEHGLSWVDFWILNGIWAATIILLEVPSGALADTIGRKTDRFLGPLHDFGNACSDSCPNGWKPIGVLLFALNRIISGVAEAAVSGADEALVYDSFGPLTGRRTEYDSRKGSALYLLGFLCHDDRFRLL